MNQFSLGNAWSLGIGFFSRQAANHAIILIGVGILLPFVLQYALAGGPMGMMNPAMMGQDALGGLAAVAGTMLLLVVLSYVLQTGSYFGSWRLGFGAAETLVGAIVYGLIMGLLAIVALIVLAFIGGMVMTQISPGVGAILLLVTLLPFLTMLYTVLAALMGVGLILMLLIMLAFGASLGEANPALALAGGGGIAILVSLAVAALLLWLAARLSCVTSAMAHRKTFNPMVGISESWRLTAANQWRILGYLALLGVVLVVIFFVVLMILGASMMAGMQDGEVPEMGLGTAIVSLIVSIPFAYLVVLVPAGIYRELGGATESAEVFA